jgi:hypothetical protein
MRLPFAARNSAFGNLVGKLRPSSTAKFRGHADKHAPLSHITET